MPLQKKDFIEIEYTGKVKNGEIFDTNIKEDLKKTDFKIEAKPFVFALGEGMFLEGVDNFLIGKEIGNYYVELSPENAFGIRNPKLIQMAPIKIFHEQKINPLPGYIFNFDNRIGKVLSVSGGRVLIDFNNPLSGKDIIYEIRILRRIKDIKEKINAMNEFLFRKNFEFEIKDKKLILKVDKGFKKFAELFKEKYKELFDLDLEAEEK
jgi:FKBP-type peptidyl-prolyl cis-trans isomerase 2